jgi:hypothetical protein
LFTLFACLLIVNAQDQESQKSLDESTLRPELQEKLCKLLLRRHLEPIDRWIIDRKAGAVFPRSQDNGTLPLYIPDKVSEHWFVLVIQLENTFDQCIWIKFYISWEEFTGSLQQFQNRSTLDEVEFWPYIQRKKQSLHYQVEQAFIEHMNDKDFEKTISYGEAHLYKLVSRDTKIEDLRKEDKIY